MALYKAIRTFVEFMDEILNEVGTGVELRVFLLTGVT